MKAMKEKITSLLEPHKQFATNTNARVRRGKLIIFMRGQRLFYYIFINGGTKSNFAQSILFKRYFWSAYILLVLLLNLMGERTKKLIIYRYNVCASLILNITKKPFPHHTIFSHNYSLVA